MSRPSGRRDSRFARSLDWHVLAGLALSTVLVLGLGTWAATATIVSTISAPAAVVSVRAPAEVRAPISGTIAQVLVTAGETVGKGQSVARLDGRTLQAERARTDARLVAALVRRARLVAERDGAATLSLPSAIEARLEEPEVAAAVADGRAAFAAAREARAREEALLDRRVDGLLRRLEALEAEPRSSSPAARGAVQADLADARLRLSRLRQGRRAEAAAAVARLGERIAELAARRAALDATLERLDVTAPAAGTFATSGAPLAGRLVREGETVGRILPPADALELDARVAAEDVAAVAIGDVATVILSGGGAGAPRLEGRVSRIAGEPTADPHTGRAVYTVRIALAEGRLAAAGARPGASAVATLVTGERTVAATLLGPLVRQIRLPGEAG